MAKNELLPFADGEDANVLPTAQWEALTDILENGFQSGIAKSEQVNRVLAQGAVASYVLGQLIVDQLDKDATLDKDTLYQNIVKALQENAKDVCLPLSGGTMSGTIKFLNGSSIYQNDNANWKTLEVNGNGACLHLRGTGSPKNPNSFGVDLTDGSTTKSLYGSIDGSLLWDGKSIITSSGGNITDVLYFGSDAHVYHINNSSWKSLELDSNSANGSGLRLRSGDSPSLAGTFDLVASINGEGYHLMGSPDGVLTWGGRKIPRIVEVRDLNTPALASLKDASVTISYLTEKQGIRVVIPFFVGGGASWSHIAMRVTGLNDTGFTVAFFNNSSTTSARIAYRCVVFEY